MSSSKENSLSDSGGIDLPSQYALRVALQTMKERCVALQQRLTTVEEENTILRNQQILLNPDLNIIRDCKNEADNLRKLIDELTQQKLQLTEHITMVAAENRQLWSRLSQLAKNDKKYHQQKQINKKQFKKNDNQHQITTSSTTGNDGSNGTQNLIRSRTFTQNSPNPLLRQKHLAALAAGTTINDKSFDDLSLEEISLKDTNDKYDENEIDNNDKKSNDDKNEDNSIITGNTVSVSLGFTYLEDDSGDDVLGGGGNSGNFDGVDLGTETKKCINKMIELKKEVLEQQNDLQIALEALNEKKALIQQECIDCKLRNANKPEMADKIVETKDDLLFVGESLRTVTNSTCSITKTKLHDVGTSVIATGTFNNIDNVDNNSSNQQRIDILEMKRNADRIDKMCPMCGKTFNETISFNDFQEHVETHFIDETDFDPLAFERNYELVSHAVGDF